MPRSTQHLPQIYDLLRAKGDADKYRVRGEPIHLIGVEFSKEQRTVVGFDVETLG